MSGKEGPMPSQPKKLLPYGELPPQQLPVGKGGRVLPTRQILRVNRMYLHSVFVKSRCSPYDQRLVEHVESTRIRIYFRIAKIRDVDDKLRQKMRCEGPDSPPCARCKAAGVDCVFEKVGKSDADAQSSLGTSE
jgi:hypothetical protein